MTEMTGEGRIMALDYGQKRVGVAFSDPFRSFAMPDVTLANTETLFDILLTLIQEKRVSHVVVGLPLHMNGSDTEQTTRTRSFAKDLSEKEVPVSFWDERMSSQAVERQMLAQDASRRTRKSHVDSQAAAFILQGFLDRLNTGGAPPVSLLLSKAEQKRKFSKGLSSFGSQFEYKTVEETHDDL